MSVKARCGLVSECGHALDTGCSRYLRCIELKSARAQEHTHGNVEREEVNTLTSEYGMCVCDYTVCVIRNINDKKYMCTHK